MACAKFFIFCILRFLHIGATALGKRGARSPVLPFGRTSPMKPTTAGGVIRTRGGLEPDKRKMQRRGTCGEARNIFAVGDL